MCVYLVKLEGLGFLKIKLSKYNMNCRCVFDISFDISCRHVLNGLMLCLSFSIRFCKTRMYISASYVWVLTPLGSSIMLH